MLNISNISKLQSGEALYTQASFQVHPGEKVGLVGKNGTGKTTLFRMIVKEDQPDKGQISFPEKQTMSYFSQTVGEWKGQSALEIVQSGDEKVGILQKQLKQIEDQLADPNLDPDQMTHLLEKMGDLQTEFEKRGGYDLESRSEEILSGLGILAQDHHKMIEEFSGGWKMRIALARVLVIQPDLILMDEPTNYLDLETILWLEKWLNQYEGAVLLTTHDREFMNNVCKKIVEISQKKFHTYSGNYDFYEKEKSLRHDQLLSEYKKQQDSIAKDREFIEKFKARASHAAQVQSRVKKLEKLDLIELPDKEQSISFEFPNPPRGSDEVVVLKELAKTWQKTDGSDHLVFSNLNTTINRLDKVAIVGVNGAGKSTLLKLICGHADPSQGEVKLGPSIKMGYFSQFSFDVLKPELTVFEQIRGYLTEASDGHLRNLLAAFLFQGDDVHKKTKFLSGGEKSRLLLAILFSQNNNLLVLDEPTNHLDIQSREILLETLKNFQGTIILVSHDRYFLREVVEKVYEIDRNEVSIFPGNYDYYLEKKQAP
jgi:ATP-binding cassette subfamily F protein 3